MYEHDFYHVEKHIAEYNGIKLPEQLRLDFNEPEYPKTVQDQILLDEHRIKHHMINEIDLLIEYNQDLSVEEAKEIVENNRKAMEDPHLMAMKGEKIENVEETEDSEEEYEG
jgi:hypothetical protein